MKKSRLNEYVLNEYVSVFALSENEAEQLKDLWDQDAELFQDQDAFDNCPCCKNGLKDFQCSACGFGIDHFGQSEINYAEADCGC